MKHQCAYARCKKEFTPTRRGMIYHSPKCRYKDWRLRKRKAPFALTRAFDVIGLPLPHKDIETIIEKVKLEWLEWWLREWAWTIWKGYDFQTL